MTFGAGTKQGSRLGLMSDGSSSGGGGSNAAFSGLTRPPAMKSAMRKSQSIAAPQFMLSHQNSIAPPPPLVASPGVGGGDEGNASFPIYFNKLSQEGSSSSSNETGNGGDGGGGGKQSPVDATPASMAMRSKSVNTLQYYYKNPLPGVRDPGQILSGSQVDGTEAAGKNNLKFKDLLDVGDGVENDLNVHSRNQRWKEFRTFSSKLGTIGDSEQSEGDDGEGENDAGAVAEDQAAAAPPGPPPTTLGRPMGAHRDAVSVQDLSVLRRAAARMGDRGGGAASGSSTALNAMMSSRLGANASGGNSNAAPFSSFPAAGSRRASAGADDTMEKFRRALMASSGNLSSLASGSSSSRGGGPHKPQGYSSGLGGASGLGRRSRTVGAGLAYGGHNMSTSGRLSRFDLTTAESVGSFAKSVASSTGSTSVQGGGRNEEW